MSDAHRAFELALTESMEMFVLAHEYAHIVLGHNLRLAAYAGHSEYYERAVESEFAADVWAQDLLAGRYGGARGTSDDPLDRLIALPLISQAAPLLLFLYVEFLNRFLSIDATHPLATTTQQDRWPQSSVLESADDHPAPMERFRRMREYLDRHGHWQARHRVGTVLEIVSTR